MLVCLKKLSSKSTFFSLPAIDYLPSSWVSSHSLTLLSAGKSLHLSATQYIMRTFSSFSLCIHQNCWWTFWIYLFETQFPLTARTIDSVTTSGRCFYGKNQKQIFFHFFRIFWECTNPQISFGRIDQSGLKFVQFHQWTIPVCSYNPLTYFFISIFTFGLFLIVQFSLTNIPVIQEGHQQTTQPKKKYGLILFYMKHEKAVERG